MKSKPTPWRVLVATAHSIGLRPPEFWRLSLKEWRALIAPAANQSLGRVAFDALARRFPDKT
jgi:uncharacterized phage protein (TIGR02216 family)